jgi:peptide/nickel transport system permease protein
VGRFVARRLVYMVITLLLVSVVAFAIIQLPPGDFLTSELARLQNQGQSVDMSQIASLKKRYGLDQSAYVQYWKWISGIVLHGDFGQSFELHRPVSQLIGDRLPLTVTLGIATLLFSWSIALPAGMYAAVRRYSVGDYAINIVSFLGMAIPGFLLALTFSYLSFRYFGQSVGGLFSPEYEDAQWNLGKVLDLLSHLWLPVLVIGIEGTAGTIRITRANLLDELAKSYVVTARSKGLSERRLILKYPVRVALNPFFSTVGWVLPGLVNGEVIVAQVLGLQTTGPLLLEALKSQDMYLAGGIILVVAALTVMGTLASDIILALVDPRIRIGMTSRGGE